MTSKQQNAVSPNMEILDLTAFEKSIKRLNSIILRYETEDDLDLLLSFQNLEVKPGFY